MYEIDSSEAAWNTGRSDEQSANLGHKIRLQGRLLPGPPVDTLHDIRTEMVDEMRKLGIVVEAHHHEVATAGQCEIDMKFPDLLKMADQIMWYKYIIKNVAKPHGKTATFMPKPIFGDNGSGMHTHISLWKGGKPLFAGDGYAGLSEIGLYAIGGILKHGRRDPGLRRPDGQQLPPAGARLRGAGRRWPCRSATARRPVRIPMYSASPKAKRVEFRCPDPTGQPLPDLHGHDDGDDRRHPEQDRPRRAARPRHLRHDRRGAGEDQQSPGSLDEALEALEKDHDFLLKGDVFTEDLIDTWINVEARQGNRPDPPPPAPVRVRPVLQLLNNQERQTYVCRAVGWHALIRACKRGQRPPRPSRWSGRATPIVCSRANAGCCSLRSRRHSAGHVARRRQRGQSRSPARRLSGTPALRIPFPAGGRRSPFVRGRPAGISRTDDNIRNCIAAFHEEYQSAWNVLTCPFAGIPDLITELRRRGIPLAVLSNKPHEFTRQCIQAHFPDASDGPASPIGIGPFTVVFGERDGVPPKPDPAGAMESRPARSAGRSDSLLGRHLDRHADCTRRRDAAHRRAWGFRDRAELLSAGAESLLTVPRDLLPLISKA